MKKFYLLSIIMVWASLVGNALHAQAAFSLTSPANGEYTSSTPTFTWAASSGAASYQLYIDDVLIKSSITATNYQVDASNPISQGMHTWYIIAVGSSNLQSNETWSFRVDATTPNAFNLTSPANNSWTNNLQPTFQWSASSDANSGLAKYQLWIDGALNVDNIPVTSTTVASATDLSNGTHTWQIKAVDKVGNTRNSTQTWTVKEDNLPPGIGTSSCLYFDGNSGCYVTTNTNIHISYNFTIEAWVKFLSGSQSNPRIISKQDDGWGMPGEYCLYLSSSGSPARLIFWIGNVGYLQSKQTLNANTWYHVAVTFSGNPSSSTMNLYVNGILDNTINTSGSILSTNQNLIFGRKGIGTDNFDKFHGWLDEVRVWNCTRTQAQINSNKDVALSGKEPDLLGYWRFNEGVGNVVKDNSSNHFNGTNVGATYSSSSLLASYNACNLKIPNPNQYVNTATPTFSWGSAPDSGIGFQKFQLWIDGALNKDNLSDSTCQVTTPLSYGAHTWYVVAFDSLGNNQPSSQQTFYVDNAKPLGFDLASPANDSIVNLPTPNFSWNATTDSVGGSGLRKYQLWINGAVNRDSIPVSQTTVAPSKALVQGVYTWFVKAYDNVGNVRQSNQTQTFYVDWDPPTDFTLITPTDNQTVTTNRPTFKWHPSSDIGSGLVNYELDISGYSPITLATLDTTYALTFNLPNGSYSWFVKAYDRAGNVTSSNSNALTVTYSTTGIDENTLVGITVFPNPTTGRITVKADDSSAGIIKVEVYSNVGQLITTVEKIVPEKSLSIDLSSFHTGIYFLKIYSKEKVGYWKVLKQ